MAQHWRVGGVPEHFNLPWQLGVEEGYFAAAGLELSFRDYPTGTGAMCADLRSGELDLAVALTEGLLMDMAHHRETVMVAPFVLSPLEWGIHVGAHSPYQQTEELRGQTLAISRLGSGSHLMGLLWAREQGWEQVPELLSVGGIDALQQSVTDGRAGAFLWERFTTLPRVKSGHLRRVDLFPTPWPCFMIAARSEIAEHPDLPRLLATLYTQSLRCQENAQETLPQIARRYDLSADEAAAWFAGVRWATRAELPTAELAHCYTMLGELGLLPAEPPALEQLLHS